MSDALVERLAEAARAEALREAADMLDRRASGGTAYHAAARDVRALASADTTAHDRDVAARALEDAADVLGGGGES